MGTSPNWATASWSVTKGTNLVAPLGSLTGRPKGRDMNGRVVMDFREKEEVVSKGLVTGKAVGRQRVCSNGWQKQQEKLQVEKPQES